MLCIHVSALLFFFLSIILLLFNTPSGLRQSALAYVHQQTEGKVNRLKQSVCVLGDSDESTNCEGRAQRGWCCWDCEGNVADDGRATEIRIGIIDDRRE